MLDYQLFRQRSQISTSYLKCYSADQIESRCYSSQADVYNIHHIYAPTASIQQSTTCKENTTASFLRFENRLNRAGGSLRLFPGCSAQHLCSLSLPYLRSVKTTDAGFNLALSAALNRRLWSDWPRIAT